MTVTAAHSGADGSRRPPRPRGALLLAVLSALPLAGCGGDAEVNDPEHFLEEFLATLSAANVVGQQIESEGTGTAELAWDSTTFDYRIEVRDMTGVTAAHIHGPGETDENANIILTFFEPGSATGDVDGELVSGSLGEGSELLTTGITLDSVLTLMRTGNAYVLVHSQEYPNGEIRGQVERLTTP